MKSKILILFFTIFLLSPSSVLFAQEKEKAKSSENLEAQVQKKKTSQKKRKKKKNKRASINPNKVANRQKVSQVMAEAWCDKYEQCAAQKEMDYQSCKETLKKFFYEGFERPYQGQRVEVTEGTLSTCQSNVKRVSCNRLKQLTQLEGCEFIVYLNRY